MHLFLSATTTSTTSAAWPTSPACWPGARSCIHPPEEALTGVDPLAAVAELVRRPYNPVDLAGHEARARRALREGENEVAGHVVRLRPPAAHGHERVVPRRRRARASPPTRGRTPPRSRSPRASASGCTRRGTGPATRRWPRCRRSCAPGYAAHSEATAVAGLAAQAGVGRLILVHLNPLAGEARTSPHARRGAGGVPAHRRASRTGRSLDDRRRLTRPRAPREDSPVASAMIRFRDKRFLAVAIVVAALVVFVLPAFVAFRYTAPEQRGQFLTQPVARLELRLGRARRARATPSSRRRAWRCARRTGSTRARPSIPARCSCCSSSPRQPYTFTHTIDGRTLTSTVVPSYRFIWQVQGVVDTVSDSTRHHRRAARLQDGAGALRRARRPDAGRAGAAAGRQRLPHARRRDRLPARGGRR